MRKLLFIMLLIGVLAHGQTKIKIDQKKFTFENIEYSVQDDSEKDGTRYITAYYQKDGKMFQFLFLTDADYNTFSMHDYQKGLWYDFDVEKAEMYLRKTNKK